MLLFADAEGSLERLRALAVGLERQVPGAVASVPGLKDVGRVFAKVLEKYRGDFSKITDLARATIKCRSLPVLLAVLQQLSGSDQAFTLVLIKKTGSCPSSTWTRLEGTGTCS